jgi:hypothetical protein
MITVNFYNRGLKLKLIGGPHSEEKMLYGPHFNEKSLNGLQITIKTLKSISYS